MTSIYGFSGKRLYPLTSLSVPLRYHCHRFNTLGVIERESSESASSTPCFPTGPQKAKKNVQSRQGRNCKVGHQETFSYLHCTSATTTDKWITIHFRCLPESLVTSTLISVTRPSTVCTYTVRFTVCLKQNQSSYFPNSSKSEGFPAG